MFALKALVNFVVTFFLCCFFYGFLSADPSRNPNRKKVEEE